MRRSLHTSTLSRKEVILIVFVHGVPETAALYDKVQSQISEPSVALELPGFGCERPSGFGATQADYAAWLVSELEGFDEPVDLVGHDWGSPLVFHVATAHGQLVRSWVVDSLAIMSSTYVWHDFAQIWQTPEVGEEFWAGQLAADLDTRAGIFEAFGVSHDDAVALAARIDETMASCILDLYRSALPNPRALWPAPLAPTVAPGLVLLASQDPFGNDEVNRALAEELGASVAVLEGLSHFWAVEGPEQATVTLEEFFERTRRLDG